MLTQAVHSSWSALSISAKTYLQLGRSTSWQKGAALLAGIATVTSTVALSFWYLGRASEEKAFEARPLSKEERAERKTEAPPSAPQTFLFEEAERRVPITLRHADITKCEKDAVVNAANSTLMGGGGVDAAIHRAGGSQIDVECIEIKKSLPGGLLAVGGAVVTSGGKMPAPWCIHAVGPTWRQPTSETEAVKMDLLLVSAYKESLLRAEEKECKTIAMPALSVGLFHYPIERAAPASVQGIQDGLKMCPGIAEVEIVFWADNAERNFQAFARALEASSLKRLAAAGENTETEADASATQELKKGQSKA